MRGVTRRAVHGRLHDHISTRTPHAGSDVMGVNIPLTIEFQPALPMRGVTCRQKAQIAFKLFQPALPMRGVTGNARD